MVIILKGDLLGFRFLVVLSLFDIVGQVDLLSRELVLKHSEFFIFIGVDPCLELGNLLFQRVGI